MREAQDSTKDDLSLDERKGFETLAESSSSRNINSEIESGSITNKAAMTVASTTTTAPVTNKETSADDDRASRDDGRSNSIATTATIATTSSSYHHHNHHHHQDQVDGNHNHSSSNGQHHSQNRDHVTPYERLSTDLAHDPRIMKEITLGRRIAFYRIRGEIGIGNFSQVKLGIHMLTKEKVAIKILDKTKLDRKTQQWLSREITSMERLHHPNVIRLYEVVETLAKLHIVMEYAGGGELFTKICNEGRLPEDEAKCLFAQLVAAVDHMHTNHIIHRDLKAENVFYANPRWIKVGDFGFSTVSRSHETLDTFCGSPPYAAPELFKDEHYFGSFVDIWAMGIILYFMVTGLMPFRAERVATLKKCILDGSYSVPAYVSDACVFLIRSILKHIPQDRFTLAEMKRSEWLEGQEFPGALQAYKLTPSPGDLKEMSGEEREARSILENLGINDNHFRQSSIKDSRSSITGTYRIVLHRVQKRSAGLPDGPPIPGATSTSRSSGIGGGDDSPEFQTGRGGYSMTAVEKRRGRKITPGNTTARSVGSKPQSKTCTIL